MKHTVSKIKYQNTLLYINAGMFFNKIMVEDALWVIFSRCIQTLQEVPTALLPQCVMGISVGALGLYKSALKTTTCTVRVLQDY